MQFISYSNFTSLMQKAKFETSMNQSRNIQVAVANALPKKESYFFKYSWSSSQAPNIHGILYISQCHLLLIEVMEISRVSANLNFKM